MKLYRLLAEGWNEVSNIPPDVEDDHIHSLLLFQHDHCTEEHEFEIDPSITFNFTLNEHSVEFQREDDELQVKGLLCSLALTNPFGDENEYKIKFQCQTISKHLGFIIESRFAAINDGEFPPDDPESFVKKILESQVPMISAPDGEKHVTEMSLVQIELKDLITSLKISRDLLQSPKATSVPFKKLHVSQAMRPTCKPQISKYKSMMEQDKFDWDSTIFDVVKHPTINGHFEIVNGCARFLAGCEQKATRKYFPEEIHCKIYQTSTKFGTLVIGLNGEKNKKEQPLSNIDKVALTRRLLETQKISRHLVSTNNSDIRKLHDYLFKNDALFKSFPTLVGLPSEIFDNCANVALKFSNNEICYSSEKDEICPPHYKIGGIRTLNSDVFWRAFVKCYRLNPFYAINTMNKMDLLTYGITDALNAFKNVPMVLSEQLKKSGVEYDKTLAEAVIEFDLPEGTTVEQAHFLLVNRHVQKQCTRKTPLPVEDAKKNIATFLSKVNNIETDHYPNINEIEDFQFIVCFAPFNWQNYVLPENCLIFDLCHENDEKLGHEISSAWNITVVTKYPELPVDGNVPNVTNSLRIFYLTGEEDKDGSYARELLQEKADEKNIKLGNVMTIENLLPLFKFVNKKAACLYYHPPLQFIELLADASVNALEDCSAVTIITESNNIIFRLREKIAKHIKKQWEVKAKEVAELPKPRKRKADAISSSTSDPISPSSVLSP